MQGIVTATSNAMVRADEDRSENRGREPAGESSLQSIEFDSENINRDRRHRSKIRSARTDSAMRQPKWAGPAESAVVPKVAYQPPLKVR